MAKSLPNPFRVKSTQQISPNMLRITLTGDAISQYPIDAEGGYIKLFFPRQDNQKPLLRTYTIANLDHQNRSMDIDFVIHEDGGPASIWASKALPGDQINIGGPGPAKTLDLSSDWFLIAGDLTALPAIRTNLKTLPKDAHGYLVLELYSEADKKALDIPLEQLSSKLDIIWLINPSPRRQNVLSEAIMSLEWLEGIPSIWVAGELEEVLKARAHLKTAPDIEKGRMYVSSYWQNGMTEDRHKVEKKKRL